MKKIIALATCHNRRDKTLRALKSLYEQALPEDCVLEVCLVDDGSSDGTAEAVVSAFPNTVLLSGSGSLYWAGGMRHGWDRYVQHQNYDYLVVFNDDIDLYAHALAGLLSVAHDIELERHPALAVAGAFREPGSDELSYGGVVRESRWHPLRFKKIPPLDSVQSCDTLNMNFTLISRAALDLIGFFSPEFVHSAADYDFGLRLREAGGKIVLAPGYIGECASNPETGTVYVSGNSLKESWRRFTDVKYEPLKLRAIYYRRHGGLLWPLLWALTYFRFIYENILSLLISNRKPKKQQ